MSERASSTLHCSAAQARRTNKPLMERRRRERINRCLGELKGLVLDALKKDSSRYSKLEKADILEMTVKHLRGLQRNQITAAMANDPSVIAKYQAGYVECAQEVTRYLGSVDGINNDVKSRLMGHLTKYSHHVGQSHTQAPARQNPHFMQPIKIEIPTASSATLTPPSSTAHAQSSSLNHSNIVSNNPYACTQMGSNGHSLNGAIQIVPTTLPNGEIAFVLPNHGVPQGLLQPVPMTGVVPTTSSSSSSSSSAAAPHCVPRESYSPPRAMEASVKLERMSPPCSKDSKSGVNQVYQPLPIIQGAMWRPW